MEDKVFEKLRCWKENDEGLIKKIENATSKSERNDNVNDIQHKYASKCRKTEWNMIYDYNV